MELFNWVLKILGFSVENPNGFNRNFLMNGTKEEFYKESGYKKYSYKKFYKNGSIWKDFNYGDWERQEGIQKEYYKNGQLFKVYNLKYKGKDGVCKEYYKNGQLFKEEHWEINDKESFSSPIMTKSQKFYRNGEVISNEVEIEYGLFDGENRIFINGFLEWFEKDKTFSKNSWMKTLVDTKDIRYNRTVDLDIDMDSIYRKMDEINDPRRKNDEGYLRWKKKEDLIKSVIEDESKIEINHNTIVYIENLEKESTLKDFGNDWDLDVDEVIEKLKENIDDGYSDENISMCLDGEQIGCSIKTNSWDIIESVNELYNNEYFLIIKDVYHGEKGYTRFSVENPVTEEISDIIFNGGEYDEKTILSENEKIEFDKLDNTGKIEFNIKYQEVWIVKKKNLVENGWEETIKSFDLYDIDKYNF